MIKGLHTSALGMAPKSLKLDVIANNLANINSTGFKKSNVFVRELIKADIAVREGNTKPIDEMIKQSQQIDFSQGTLLETKNPLDVAISGKGFFVIETPQGTRYTRNGNFTLASDGSLVTAQGFKVLGEKGTIYFPNPAKTQSKQINISQKGEISIGTLPIDKLQIVDIPVDSISQDVKYAGENLFSAQNVTPMSINSKYEINQGFLEESNVNALEEMVKMIELNSNMQMDQKAIRYQDMTLQQTNDIGRI
jgi:flagellar basal-body rod protein FlgG